MVVVSITCMNVAAALRDVKIWSLYTYASHVKLQCTVTKLYIALVFSTVMLLFGLVCLSNLPAAFVVCKIKAIKENKKKTMVPWL